MDLRDVPMSPLSCCLPARASGVDAFDEQLACEPEPDVSVELELIDDVFVSELGVRESGFLAIGDVGGEARELMHDSLSLSSVADVRLMISEVLGGLIGGDFNIAVLLFSVCCFFSPLFVVFLEKAAAISNSDLRSDSVLVIVGGFCESTVEAADEENE